MSDCSFSTKFIHFPPISMDCMVMWWKILQQLGSRRIGIGSGHRIHTQIGRLHLRNCQVKCADSNATGVVGSLLGYFLVLNQYMWYHVTWWILVDLRIFRIRGFFWFFRSLWAHHSPWLCGQDLRLGQIGQQIQYNIGQTSNLNKSKNDMVQWSPTVHQQTCHWIGLREKTGPGNPHIFNGQNHAFRWRFSRKNQSNKHEIQDALQNWSFPWSTSLRHPPTFRTAPRESLVG